MCLDLDRSGQHDPHPIAMKPIIRGAQTIESPPPGSVITLGVFDGVHIGHQALVRQTVATARDAGVVSVAFTFDPHPARTLAPARAPSLLMGVEARAETLLTLGLDHVVIQTFDHDFATITADAFVRDFLVAPLRPRHVIVGFNFAYGKDRRGDQQHLVAQGDAFGFTVDVVTALHLDGDVVSSTRVRNALDRGDLSTVNRLLGRPFSVTGTVVPGDRLGRTIGFPTANIRLDGEKRPPSGVYATRFRRRGDPDFLPSVTNVGHRPTVGGGAVTVETFVIDFEADLYGTPVEVELVERLRAEQRFDGLEGLREQLAQDVEAARTALARSTAQ